MRDRGCQAAREHVSRSIADAGDIQRPEAHSHNQGVPGASGLRKGEVDRSARRRLEAERRLLDLSNGRETIYREGIEQSAGLIVGISNRDVARTKRRTGADGDARGKLSGRIEGARVHGDPCTEDANSATLEVVASENNACQSLPQSAGIWIDRT